MRKITTRLISAALAASMMLSVCPVGAFAAAGGPEPEYGVATQAVTTIGPVTSYTYYIRSSGTYNLSGGRYTTSANSIYITATGDVTLNITGDITATGSKAFINVDSACNLTINGVYNGVTYKISQTSTTGKANVVNNPGGATITFNGGIYEAKTDGGGPVVANATGGTINAKNATFRVTGTSDAGQAFNNTDSTLNIYDGTVIDNGTMAKWTCIVGGTVNMYGGTITAGAKASAAISAADVTITGGTIKNSQYGISMGSKASSVKIDGNVTFENNTADVYLTSGKKFTLTDAYTSDHVISVAVADTVSANSKRQITTSGTSTKAMLNYVKAADSSCDVRYDASGNYLYLWKHSHTWNYTANGDTITAKCTTDSDCRYYTSGLTLTLTAPEVQTEGDGKSCTATVENGLGVTGATVGSVSYEGVNGTTYTKSTTAPKTAGTYKATVTAGGATAEVTYTIQAKTYGITVEGGTADKTEAQPKDNVTFTARKAEKGEKFTGWTFNVDNVEFVSGDANSTTVTVKMPASKLTATAHFENELYAIKVNGGSAVEKAAYNTRVELTVDENFPDEQEFDHWTCDVEGVTFEKDGDAWYFDMPAEPVEITAVYKDKTYTIKVNGGTADKATAKKGEEVTLTVDEIQYPTGQEFDYWTVNGKKINGSTFPMPSGGAEVEAVYKNKFYDLTVDGVSESVEYGKEKTVDVPERPGKTFTGWTVEGLEESEYTEDETSHTLSFRMPDGKVRLTPKYEDAAFEPGKEVNDEHFVTTENAVADKSKAKTGETVTVTADEKPGKEFTGWSIEGGVTEWDDQTTWGVVTFTMPGNDVTVTANYKDSTFEPVGPVNDAHIITTVDAVSDKDSAKAGETVTVTADEKPGKEFTGWSIEGGVTEWDETTVYGTVTFTMPGNDVMVTANYKDSTFEPVGPVNDAHFLTVDGEAAGTYKEGEEVTLTAAAPAEEEVFKGWKVIAPDDLDVTTDGLTITFLMPSTDVELKTVYDAKTITELDPDKYEGLEKNEEIGGVTVKEDYELELPENVVVQEPVENKGTIVSGKFEEPVTGGNIAGGTYLEVKDADAVTGGVFAQEPKVKQGGTRSPMDLLKVVDADDTLMKQCAINDIIVPQSAETYALSAENGIESVDPVAFIIGEQTITVKYTGDSSKFSGWTSQDIDLSQAAVSENGKALTFDITAIGDKVVTIKATYEAEKFSITAEGSVTVNGLAGNRAKAGDLITITLDKSIIPEGMAFNGWSLTPDSLMVNMDYMAETISFTMPACDVTATALTCPAELKDDTDYTPLGIATGVVGGAVITGLLGWQAYSLAVDSYVQLFMPYLPSNRAELALLLWHDAEEPACPGEAYTDIDAEADDKEQIAARWAVESGLLDEADKEDAAVFEPTRWVSKFTAAKAWHKAQKMKKQ